MAENPLLVFPNPVRSDRRKLRGGAGRTFHFPSAERQSRRLGPKFAALRRQFEQEATRVQTVLTGTEPEQVVVLEAANSVEELYKALERKRIPGFEWLEELDKEIEPDADFYFEDQPEMIIPGRVYLVMSNQTGIQQLLSLWDRFTTSPDEKFPHGWGRLKHIFEQLKDVRRWGIKDRIYETGVLKYWREECKYRQDPIRFDVELWFRNDAARRKQQFEVFKERVTQAGGQCIGSPILFEEIRYHGTIVQIPATNIRSFLEAIDRSAVSSFLDAPEVFLFHPIGQTAFPLPETVSSITTCQEPTSLQIAGRTPVVALLDGLPLENHPWLAGRLVVDDPDEYGELYPASDRHHGTAMASLILHGELDGAEEPLSRPIYVRPILKPDPKDWVRPRRERIPDDTHPLDVIFRAVLRIVERDADQAPAAPDVRIINLSVGDPDRHFHYDMSPWARLLDWLSWKYNLLFIVSAGNYTEEIELDVPRDEFPSLSHSELQRETIRAMAANLRQRRLLAPAESVNALTVGAVHSDKSGIKGDGRNIDPYNADVPLPSPYNRVGLGFRNSIKPDVLFSGGRQFYEEKQGNVHTKATLTLPDVPIPIVGHKVASPVRANGATYISGTSNAAALVSRAATMMYDELLELQDTPNGSLLDGVYFPVLLKAMLVHAAQWGEAYPVIEDSLKHASNSSRFKEYVTRFLGYGEVSVNRVKACTGQRATMLGCGKLGVDEGHLYNIPLPTSLNSQAIWRRVVITLAWLTPINCKNRKYRKAALYFDFPLQDIDEALGVSRQGADWMAVRRGTVQHEVFEGENAAVYSEGELLSIRVNCREDAGKLDAEEKIAYALAVTLEVAENTGLPIYEEIRARIQVPVQISASS